MKTTSAKTVCQSCGATVAIPDTMTATQAARVLARRASAAPSPARQAASRANGRKGGRPRRHQKNSMGNENEQKGQPS